MTLALDQKSFTICFFIDHENFAQNVQASKAIIQTSSCKEMMHKTQKMSNRESYLHNQHCWVLPLPRIASHAVCNSPPPPWFDSRCLLQVLKALDVAMAA